MLQAGLYHYVALPVIKIRWIVIGKLMLRAGLNHYVALPVWLSFHFYSRSITSIQQFHLFFKRPSKVYKTYL
jgi:hypothetical protein